MFERIAIRNIPNAVWEALTALAKEHERSTEAEARFAIASWITQHNQEKTMKITQNQRCIEVSNRLNEVLAQVNRVMYGRPFKPSLIAEKMGETKASDLEAWFSGESEPTFAQLEKVAEFLGCESEYLKHGQKQIFPVAYQRIPEIPAEAVKWLLDLREDKKVQHLHLLRCADETGSLVIVKQYEKWVCKNYTTPYHVSEKIGGGGEAALAHLSVTLELLYKYYAKNEILVTSYLVESESFDRLCSGIQHPLNVLKVGGQQSTWWEDFWDVDFFKSNQYWPGWQSLCERINRVVEYKESLLAQRTRIRNGEWRELS